MIRLHRAPDDLPLHADAGFHPRVGGGHVDRSGGVGGLLLAELDRPVVIHCREAVDDTLALMRDFASVPGVFHCFTGASDEARRIVKAGYLLGFTGVVTFKRNDDLRAAVRLTPRDRLLVETDAPYLTPEPMRKQKTNEPSFVVHTAAVVAKEWGVSLEELDAITTQNTLRFFRWT